MLRTTYRVGYVGIKMLSNYSGLSEKVIFLFSEQSRGKLAKGLPSSTCGLQGSPSSSQSPASRRVEKEESGQAAHLSGWQSRKTKPSLSPARQERAAPLKIKFSELQVEG